MQELIEETSKQIIEMLDELSMATAALKTQLNKGVELGIIPKVVIDHDSDISAVMNAEIYTKISHDFAEILKSYEKNKESIIDVDSGLIHHALQVMLALGQEYTKNYSTNAQGLAEMHEGVENGELTINAVVIEEIEEFKQANESDDPSQFEAEMN